MTQTQPQPDIDFRSVIVSGASANGRFILNDMQRLREEGLAIQIDIGGAGIFTTSLDWSELGVGGDSTRARWFTKGRKYLFPKEDIAALNNVISKMRQAYTGMTHDIAAIRPWRYLHYKQYRAWSETWHTLTTQLDSVVQDMIAHYDQAVDTLAADYNTICREAWESITAGGEEYAIFKGQTYDDLDQFTDAVVAAVLAKVPSPDRIRDEIRAVYRVAAVQGVEDIAREEARASQLRAEAEAARLQAVKVNQELDHNERMLRLEEEAKRQQIELMMRAEADRIRAEIDTITSPLEETFTALRLKMSEAASDMIRSIQANGGKVHGRTAQRALESLSELFDLRSIVDDRRLRERLDELKAAVGPVGKDRTEAAPERDPSQVIRALEQIQSLVETAREDFMTAEPSRFAMLELDEDES